uniref:B box-type domain-containing protein n=1 Tax=Nannospalax galili TaxID=1026970 RepID=A0A8C6RZP3_NANGA
MASAVLGSIQEEVTCPICLELLKEPVSADCGHTFCRNSIKLNYESTKDQREGYQFGNLQTNQHVAKVVERVKGMMSCPEEARSVHHCTSHGERLQLFCEKDRKLICWLCQQSQEHHSDQTLLIEEVAQEYRLQVALQKLMTDKKKCENWKDDLQEDGTFWQKQIQSDVWNVQEEFKRLRDILDSQEKNELQKLKQEEEDVLSSLAECENKWLMASLISDLQCRLQGSTLEMLQVRLKEVPAPESQEMCQLSVLFLVMMGKFS